MSCCWHAAGAHSRAARASLRASLWGTDAPSREQVLGIDILMGCKGAQQARCFVFLLVLFLVFLFSCFLVSCACPRCLTA
jgi:hypothetical protein